MLGMISQHLGSPTIGVQVAAVQTQNQQLTVHITEVERCKTSIVRDIQELQAKSDAAIEHNASLREEVHNMHSQLNVLPHPLFCS